MSSNASEVEFKPQAQDPEFGVVFVLQGGASFGPLTVHTLSAGGALLRGPTPMLRCGPARAILKLSARRRFWVRTTVEVRDGSDGSGPHTYLAFRGLDSRTQDQIQKFVLDRIATGAQPAGPAVLVLTASRELQLALEHGLRSLGRRAISFGQPLNAIWWLEPPASACNVVLIDSALVAGELDLLQFFATWYPDQRRVLVRNLHGHRPSAAALDLAHGVLDVPWRQDALEIAVGASSRVANPAKRILFVDDEALVLAGLQVATRRALRGCETVWTTSGKGALSELRARPFDVVVSDLRMPEMDGVALLNVVKHETPNVLRVLLSGYDTSAAALVANHILRKPCSVADLREALLAG
jgi:CheY-like chemotaxis protein